MRASGWLLLAALLHAGPAAGGDEPAERVVLRWQSVPGAAGYELQVATDAAFTPPVLEVRAELAGHRLAPSEVARYWRVRAVDAEGRPGPWSTVKTIAPLRQAPAPGVGAAPARGAGPVLLDVPPLAPADVEPAAPQPPQAVGPEGQPSAMRPDVAPPSALVPDADVQGVSLMGVLRDGRPGAMIGWRANLLGVTAPSVAAEGTWPLPWFGTAWAGALRAGWWRERATVRAAGGWLEPFDATADTFPIRALVTRTFAPRWARFYGGAGLGVDLVRVQLPVQGALEATPALDLVAGAGRRVGPGEACLELAGGLGGVDGPLGRLRTGGLSLSLGYRLGR